jgi:hypothetical protein
VITGENTLDQYAAAPLPVILTFILFITVCFCQDGNLLFENIPDYANACLLLNACRGFRPYFSECGSVRTSLTISKIGKDLIMVKPQTASVNYRVHKLIAW